MNSSAAVPYPKNAKSGRSWGPQSRRLSVRVSGPHARGRKGPKNSNSG